MVAHACARKYHAFHVARRTLQISAARRRSRVEDCRLQITDYRLQITDYKLQIESCRFQAYWQLETADWLMLFGPCSSARILWYYLFSPCNVGDGANYLSQHSI